MVQNYKELDIYKSFIKSSLPSTKSNLHLHVYHEVLQKFRNRKITFVEIGVKSGGSLLMWRDWLGKDARIIGIDLDPNAKKWKNMVLKFLLETKLHQTSGKIFSANRQC